MEVPSSKSRNTCSSKHLQTLRKAHFLSTASSQSLSSTMAIVRCNRLQGTAQKRRVGKHHRNCESNKVRQSWAVASKELNVLLKANIKKYIIFSGTSCRLSPRSEISTCEDLKPREAGQQHATRLLNVLPRDSGSP